MQREREEFPNDFEFGGSLVKLQGLRGGVALSGFSTRNLTQYNGRMGRVVDDPPPWALKACGPGAEEELVTVLLDSRSTDQGRSNGVWIAVPPGCLRVQ